MQNLPDIVQTTNDIIHSLPFLAAEWALVVGFLSVILLDLFVRKPIRTVAIVAFFTLLVSGFFLLKQWNAPVESQLLFNGMFYSSKAVIQFKILVIFVSLFSLIFFYQDSRLRNHPKGINDFISIFLAANLAMFLFLSSANLLMLYLSIEMLSLACYLMVTYNAYNRSEAEAGMKYVLFGAVASAIMLYGISLVYGFTGTINLYGDMMLTGLMAIGTLPSSLAIGLVLVGVAFKLSAVPFHFWTPDAYQAAPTSVVSFLSTAPKIAAFGFLYFLIPHFQVGDVFNQFILLAAGGSMILGNVVAVLQDNAKRMMAYSAIGHTGFMLMLFVLPQNLILNALLFYLVIYSIANIGTFMSLAYIENEFNVSSIAAFKGLGKSIPAVGVCLVVLLMSLIGLPPVAGFVAKFIVFSSLISLASTDIYVSILLVVAVLTTVISLFYYLKIPLNFFLKKSEVIMKSVEENKYLMALIVVLSILIFFFGILPGSLSLFLQ